MRFAEEGCRVALIDVDSCAETMSLVGDVAGVCAETVAIEASALGLSL